VRTRVKIVCRFTTNKKFNQLKNLFDGTIKSNHENYINSQLSGIVSNITIDGGSSLIEVANKEFEAYPKAFIKGDLLVSESEWLIALQSLIDDLKAFIEGYITGAQGSGTISSWHVHNADGSAIDTII